MTDKRSLKCTYSLSPLFGIALLAALGGTNFPGTARAAAPPAPVTPNAVSSHRFFVECHCFIPAAETETRDYSYHFRARGYSRSSANGIEVILDRQKLQLSVKRRETAAGDYALLYDSLTPEPSPSESVCLTADCASTSYEFQALADVVAIAYDADEGVIAVKHQRRDGTVLQGRGGCVFLGLP